MAALTPEASQSHVERLRRLDACALSDALDSLGLRGAAPGLPRRSGGGVVAGRVLTVQVGVAAPGLKSTKHLGVSAIEAAGEHDVIVVEQNSGLEAGCWGGLLTLAAKMAGVAGVIADGPLRDVDEAIGYDFPIFSRSLTTCTARGRVAEIGFNVPITVSGVAVAPGDYAIADGSGVVFIGQAKIEEVLEMAETIAGREAAMAKALLAGKSPSAVMGGQYEQMLERKP